MAKTFISTFTFIFVILILAACGSRPNNSASRPTTIPLNPTQRIIATNIANGQQTLTQQAQNSVQAQSVERPRATATQEAIATNTTIPTNTLQPTQVPTERPSRTPRPTQADTDTYFVTGSTANVRSCSNTTCDRVTTLSYGDDIEVVEAVEGVSVAGSTRWYRVLLNNGHEGFIHSSLVSRTRPVAGSSSNSSSNTSSGSSSGSTNNSGNSNNVQPTQVPASSGYSCNCNKTCDQMTCAEAQYQLNTCGCSARDRDHDGTACDSQCGG